MKIFAQLFEFDKPLSSIEEITTKFHKCLGVLKLKESFSVDVIKTGFATHFQITNEDGKIIAKVDFEMHVTKNDKAINVA